MLQSKNLQNIVKIHKQKVNNYVFNKNKKNLAYTNFIYILKIAYVKQ